MECPCCHRTIPVLSSERLLSPYIAKKCVACGCDYKAFLSDSKKGLLAVIFIIGSIFTIVLLSPYYFPFFAVLIALIHNISLELKRDTSI